MMLFSKLSCSGIACGLLFCFFLLVSASVTTAEEGVANTRQEGVETREEAEYVTVQTAGTPIPFAGEEDEEHRKTGQGRVEEEEVKEEFAEQTTGEQIIEKEDTTHIPITDESSEDLCKKPLPPENGYIKGDNYSYEAVVRVGCEEGYRLSGPSTLTCLPVPYPGAPGIWVPQDEYGCLPTVDNQGTELTSSHAIFDEETFDDRGEPHLADGSQCTAERETSFENIRCPTPSPPNNGQVIGTDYTMGATVTYTCDEGYTLIGPNHARCLAVPDPFHHRAIWDPPALPSCQLNPAPPCLLPGPGQDSTESEFTSRLDASAERLTDTMPDATPVEGLSYSCSLPAVHGPCRETIPRYFFDTTKLECLPFTYGGCQGNDNNFETFESCKRSCR